MGRAKRKRNALLTHSYHANSKRANYKLNALGYVARCRTRVKVAMIAIEATLARVEAQVQVV